MDGNGRWAKKRLMPKVVGHRQGAENLKKITRHCSDLGVKVLTVYAFSTENWKRSEEEVNDLMGLLEEYIKQFYTDDESKKHELMLLVILLNLSLNYKKL